jgi:hypothetical protein
VRVDGKIVVGATTRLHKSEVAEAAARFVSRRKAHPCGDAQAYLPT